MKISNLAKRILFAVWAIPLAWVIINSQFNIISILPDSWEGNLNPVYPLTVLIILLISLAVYEYTKMLSKEFSNNKFALIQLWLVPALINEAVFKESIQLATREHIFILILFVAAEVVFVGKGDNRWRRASMFFSGTIFFYLAGVFLSQFQGDAFNSLWKDTGDSIWLNNIGFIITATAVFMCDSMAFFTGMKFGKHKLSSISPKKTVEGSIGGLVSSMIVMTLGIHFLGAENTPLYLGPLLGIAIGVAAQVGDLSVSLIKRYFKVKDSSNLIPGHGGILDRFDSLFFSAPVIHLIISLSSKFGS